MNDEMFMRRCLDLALQGSGSVAPNPMVGAVIVHDGKIIGEGYHMQFGGPHAEVNAIQNVRDKALLKDATLFVSLEPCNHTGKTPPCTDLIIRSGIRKVVIGMQDPFPQVNGSGVTRLTDAGISVSIGCLEDECRELNKRFITFHLKKRPYVILKWAESMDGFTGKKGEQLKLSNPLSDVYTHKWRSREQAIMAGSETIQTDNPQLNVRHWTGKDPLKITVDRNDTLDSELNFFKGPSVVFSGSKSGKTGETLFIQIDKNEKNLVPVIMDHLYEMNLLSVLVEGGSRLHGYFIDSGLWDEARIFKTEKVLGTGIKAPFITGKMSKQVLADNELVTVLNK